MAEENDTQKASREAVAQVSVDSAPVLKQFVECPSCGKLWPYDGHAADVCCGKCSHNFYVPPDAITRRLIECESVLRSVVQNVPIMCRGFRATLLHSQCAGLVGEQNAIGAADTDGIRHERHERQSGGDLSSANDLAHGAAEEAGSWRDPQSDPPTMTGKILVWINDVGPAIVNVEERWMCFWNGHDETELTDPSEWDKWREILPPNDPH